VQADTTDCATIITDSTDLVNAAWHARGRAVQEVIGIARNLTASNRNVIIAGDFNEPSDLDWTHRAVSAGNVPLRAKFKVSRRLRAAGMKDVYRAVYPDELENPGYTWYDSPTGSMAGGAGPPERIDFMYVPDSENVLILGCEVGQKQSKESDHLPVSATLVFKNL
jgi:exodeoxyribonuclease-3